MAVDKLVDSTQLDSDLTSVANAIRQKGGTSAQMAFPAGFVSAVQAIPTGTTPSGSKQISITQNGTVTEDVAAYANAEITVNVQGGGGGALDDFLDGTDIEIISDVTSVRPGGISGGPSIKAIVLPECIELNNGAINGAVFTNNTVQFTALSRLYLPKVQKIGTVSLCQIGRPSPLNAIVLPSLTKLTWAAANGRAFEYNRAISKYDFGNPSLTSMSFENGQQWYNTNDVITAIILRYSGVVSIGNTNVFKYNNTNFFSFGTTCFVYVPSAQLENYKAATNWSTIYATYPDMFKTIEGSIYETQYADGTPIT